MTINDIITEVDNQKPNQYDDADKCRWLSVCEGKIIDSVFKTRQPGYYEEFNGYTTDDIDAELLVEDTYADLYKYYIYAMIDAMNGETERYSMSMTLFNNALKEFADHYYKTHREITEPLKIF